MDWLNEPPHWREEGGTLFVRTGDKTDFWRRTHYGFIRDDGHLRFETATGDFTAEVDFSGAYEELYDQAGLMLRIDSENWLKAGIEYTDGRRMLSVVVTREYSDWSTAPGPADAEWIRLRITRRADAVRVDWAVPGQPYTMMRLAHLPAAPSVHVGPMCCSPQRAGFEARFRNFAVGAPIAPDLHVEGQTLSADRTASMGSPATATPPPRDDAGGVTTCRRRRGRRGRASSGARLAIGPNAMARETTACVGSITGRPAHLTRA